MRGLLLLDKPEGITSYGAVARIKRISGEKRVGHTGTLDPLATGVLPVFLGRATALCSYLLDADKRYIARARLGIETDSCDITGNIISENEINVSPAQLETVIDGFRGEISQQPPMYSALKKDGVRLYELARRGEKADIPFRSVTVHSIEILSPLDSNGEFEFETHVSKGTYIRSLVRDIGKKCGCGAVLTALRRTETAGFKAENCVAIDKLNPENLNDFLLSEETAVGHLPAVYVTERQALRFINGGELSLNRLSLKNTADGALFRVKFNGMLLGIGICNAEKHQLTVKCVLITPGEFAAEKEMSGL